MASKEIDLWDAFSTAVFRASDSRLGAWIRGTFYILTAYNPGGRVHPAAENHEADLRLQKAIAGMEHLPMEGCSPDFSHCEASWAVRLPLRDHALEIARQFHQRAFYEVEDGILRLIDVLGRMPERELGRFRVIVEQE